jgi:hypothetical protein
MQPGEGQRNDKGLLCRWRVKLRQVQQQKVVTGIFCVTKFSSRTNATFSAGFEASEVGKLLGKVKLPRESSNERLTQQG